MRATIVGLAAALIAVPAAAKFGDVLPVGPVEGMAVGTTVKSGSGYYLAALLPSVPNASPVRDARASAIAGWLDAVRNRKWASSDSYATAGATSVWCSLEAAPQCDNPGPLSSIKLPSAMRANTPYLMKNGQVRVEWFDGDRMKFASWLTFDGDRISSIVTRSTDVPIPIVQTAEAVH